LVVHEMSLSRDDKLQERDQGTVLLLWSEILREMVVLKYERVAMMTTHRYPPRRLLWIDRANKELTRKGATDRAEHMVN